MEPEEISRLYTQKEIILNSVQEGIIALDTRNQISEMNERAARLLEEELLDKLRFNLQEKRFSRMQEYCIHLKKLFISIQPVIREEVYLGAVITILDQEEINRIAKEITGVEEINKNLRATVHEFKNNLHVILGLLQLKVKKQRNIFSRYKKLRQKKKINLVM
ncbi:Spo0B domain-containing protein [Cellulosilyticum ruminicola]|uniref:Spo0B domain-containing protein n=1 Tax=Cellulosilyticum ruminicola TaxID=425254 RepID=UPI0006D06E7E|nr:PAS domain-containing protein [Cellulosilyticum ruminicola]